jgi:hypothetical protein
MEDRFFKYAVIVSLGLHLILLVKLYTAPHKARVVKKTAELSYHLESRRDLPQPHSSVPDSRGEDLPSLPKIEGSYTDNSKTAFKNIFDAASSFKVFERSPEKVKGLKVSKEVSIPVLKSGKIDTPGYDAYTSIIRSRIRDRALENFVKFSSGDVYLTFIVRADGALMDVHISRDQTQASEALCAVGVTSIQEAAPFPPFPKELHFTELPFSIQISFQRDEGG